MADGEFHSGESLGRAMGISRAAVWKQLQRVIGDTGLAVEAVKGRGYRLRGGIELLDKAEIFAAVAPAARPLLRELCITPIVESTNDQAMSVARSRQACGVVITAEQQRAGRGRRGREWFSPFGQNLYCSVIWSFDSGARAVEGLSLAVGVAIANGLAATGLSDVELKWPNDVLWRGKKIGGILLELTGDLAGPCQVVVGFGINVAMRGDAAEQIDQPWTDVHSAVGASASRNRLLGEVLSHLLPLLDSYEQDGFMRWHAAWSARDALFGRTVEARSAAGILAGEARGLAADGALRLLTSDGEQLVHGGEVSVRAR